VSARCFSYVQEINSAFVSESELGEEDKEMRQQLLKYLDQFEK
jgi:hypothetical protein